MILNDVCVPLKDQVMNSIKAINEACVDADIKVCDALMDAYLQNSEAILLGRKEGFVQESKFGDWFQYSEDESIIKTIFLFIPRLIVNLFKQLKAKWDNYVIDKKLTDLKRRAKKLEHAMKELEEEFKQYEKKLTEIDNVSLETVDGEGKWCYSTTITNFDQVGIFYGSLKDYFENYASNCRGGDLVSLLKTNDIINQHVINTTKQSISDKRKPIPMSPDLLNDLIELRDFQKDVSSIVEKSMDEVYHWYDKEMKNKSDDDLNIDQSAVDRLLKNIRDVRDEYVKIDTMLFSEVHSMVDNMDKFYDLVDELSTDENKKRRDELKAAMAKNDAETEKVAKEIDDLEKDKLSDDEEGD